jgi:C4-type Zn-finger protein
MIIFGLKTSHLRTEPLPQVACPACSSPNSLQLSVYGRYAHVYWIPFFPVGKSAVAHCAHCQLTREDSALPDAAREPALALKKQISLPLWTW